VLDHQDTTELYATGQASLGVSATSGTSGVLAWANEAEAIWPMISAFATIFTLFVGFYFHVKSKQANERNIELRERELELDRERLEFDKQLNEYRKHGEF